MNFPAEKTLGALPAYKAGEAFMRQESGLMGMPKPSGEPASCQSAFIHHLTKVMECAVVYKKDLHSLQTWPQRASQGCFMFHWKRKSLPTEGQHGAKMPSITTQWNFRNMKM